MKRVNFTASWVLLSIMSMPLAAGEDPDKEKDSGASPSGDVIYMVDDLPPTNVVDNLKSSVPALNGIPDPEDYGKIDALTRLENKLTEYFNAREKRQAAESSASLREDGSVSGGGVTSAPTSLDNVFLTMVYGDGDNLIARVVFNGRYMEVQQSDELAPGVTVADINPSFMDITVQGKPMRLGLSSYQSMQTRQGEAGATAAGGDAPGGPPMDSFMAQPMPMPVEDSSVGGF